MALALTTGCNDHDGNNEAKRLEGGSYENDSTEGENDDKETSSIEIKNDTHRHSEVHQEWVY